MSDEDYELLDWVLSRSNTEIVTLEYCGINSENEEIVCHNLKYQLTKLNLMCKEDNEQTEQFGIVFELRIMFNLIQYNGACKQCKRRDK